MAPLVLYGMYASPPFRGVLLTCKAIGLDVEIRIVNTLNKEHHKAEFLKINPTHTIPVLDDNGYIIYDSHAIAGYLVQQYGEDMSLYPTDPKERGLIDQRLHFDSGTIFQNVRSIAISILYMGAKEISERDINNVLENYGFLESFLTPGPWIAGKNMTIADLTLGATASTLVRCVPAPVDKFPKLNAWLDKLRSLPYYDLNQKGIDEFYQAIEAKLAENNAQ